MTKDIVLQCADGTVVRKSAMLEKVIPFSDRMMKQKSQPKKYKHQGREFLIKYSML